MKSIAKLALVALVLFGAGAGYVLLSRPPPPAPASGAQPAAVQSATRPNIVLISIDTLRADTLGSHGQPGDTTPALDRLAREGVRFASAYSTSSWTPPAMASLMTGLYPLRHGVTSGHVVQRREGGAVLREVAGQQVLPEDLVVLAQVLQRAGYRTYGVTANAHLDATLGFARGFDRYECLGFTEARQVLGSFEAIAGEIRGNKAPYFLWLHLFDPHAPYFREERWLAANWQGRARFPELERITPPERYEDLNVADGERLDYVEALYRGEVRRADDATAHMLEALNAHDDALIIVVSDHGEEFLEHGMFGHAHSLYEESVRVPLIARFPDGRFAGRVIAEPVSVVDVLPTVAAVIGAAVPAAIDGRSLLPAMQDGAQEPRAIFAELGRAHPLKMAVEGGFKLIYDVNTPAHSRLYDLRADPGELADAMHTQSARAAALERTLRERLGVGADRATTTRPLSDQQVEALRSMGYVQ